MPDIVNVIVDDIVAPLGFDPELVTFDANNIYVNLKDSRCLYTKNTVAGYGGLVSECRNPWSPTGFNNRINLIVEFAAMGANDQASCDKETIDEPTIDEATIDQLYDWKESKYPELFPTHQDSMDINGYYARFYPESGVYIGSLEGRLYLYSLQLGGIIDLGELGDWVEQMEIEKMDNM